MLNYYKKTEGLNYRYIELILISWILVKLVRMINYNLNLSHKNVYPMIKEGAKLVFINNQCQSIKNQKYLIDQNT